MIPTTEQIVEAALFAADRALSLSELQRIFNDPIPSQEELRQLLARLQHHYDGRGIELVEVGSGFRFQTRSELSPWVSRLWEERPPRYSRALLETLVLIAYRQPITRGEIEEIRGVAVSSQIIKTLQEREWVRVIGHREVPGRPALLATTRQFLDYFNLKSLEQLPPLQELRSLEEIERHLDRVLVEEQQEQREHE
ncbi:SMC-Scp complex subunit ScpB [Ectothiorhodospiraceae bacterium BW-2]|nr:SMC-Scp complex subunit ScpB [Ectothiorhodospiraceae bacterium BW-2]